MTTTSELLLRWDRKRARHHQDELGMSEVGGCRRRAGYRLAHTPPTNAGGSVQAAMGSAIHDALDQILTDLAESGEMPGVKLSREVRYAGLLGHFDRFEDGVVVDTKTTSSRWAEHLKLHGPDEPHLWQVHLYGAALVKDGEEVTGVQIDYLARDTGEEWTWTGPFQQFYVRQALLWLKNVRETPLEMLSRDYMPDSAFCHSCRFAEVCWPYGLEGKDAAKVLYADDPDARRWTADLWDARERRKAAEADEKRARGALEALRPMTGTGLVDTGERLLSFRSNGVYFTARKDGRLPAVGYEEGDG